MSNIPSDHLDLPISTANSTLLSSDPVINRNIPRRGPIQGRGRGRGQSQRPHVVDNEVGTSVPGGRRNRRGPTSKDCSVGTDSPSSGNLAGSNLPQKPPDSFYDPKDRRLGREAGDPQDGSQSLSIPRNQGRSRRGQFGSNLTEKHVVHVAPFSRRPRSPPPSSDLTTRLTYALRTPPYPDCPICFNPLHPAQPTWSCSLSDNVTSCCWASFHLKCVREWAKKSTKEVRDAFVARDVNEEEYWRCPGCQTQRNQVPRSYLCFCGAVNDPKPGIATPHGCGMGCSRTRTSCDHPCPLSCHPGPCPPCKLTVHTSCHCSKTVISIRCARSHESPALSLSCGQNCGRPLRCGNHLCERECHPGECAPCVKTELVQCFCGKHSTLVGCGEGMSSRQEASLFGIDGKKITWVGRYDCGNKCGRPFDCGHHTCTKSCHRPSPSPTQCPFDPTLITNCPCGKHPLLELINEKRSKCSDPIPTCNSSCGKQLQGCTHCCSAICHLGDCPPCSIPVTVPCRCGFTTRFIPCKERQNEIAKGGEIILCDKVCGALRLCGRHQCSRTCCPLAVVSRSKAGKGKKNKNGSQQALVDKESEDTEKQWHECDLVCGKMLGCRSHRCVEPDHRGACPPCLQSSFDELVCRCGRTVVLPPVPCGTRINCTFPCNQPPPLCGHAKTPHTCHEDSSQCPACPFLTTKLCACGKSNISNVRCSQEKVSCGQPCGKLLGCGFHRCQKLCHSGACGDCSSVCGKPRKLCLPAHHPCTLPCHAPSACNESEPCSAMIKISCPCGHFEQPTKCGRSDSNQNRPELQLHCRDECGIAKRNAKLAEALGISGTKEKTTIVYSEDIASFGKTNAKFVALVEKTLNEFVVSDRKTQVLPYMPENRRKFVKELCQLYRIDTQLVDQEPRRSIQLHRRIDTRTPIPVLTAFIASQNQTPSLGKLADLRAAPPTRTVPVAGRSSIGPSSSSRGWTSVLSSAPPAETPKNARSSGATRPPTIPKPPTPVPLSNNSVRENWDSD